MKEKAPLIVDSGRMHYQAVSDRDDGRAGRFPAGARLGRL